MKEPPVKVGDTIAGKYRVESVLGVGGMGVVVEAVHLELLEKRAIKLMLPESLDNAEAVERFVREARASSRLKTEHVTRVHDVGRLEDGSPYIVMEYLEGQDLRTLLKQRGKIPASEAVWYALEACEALAEAHGAGIVHRDLKPANIFVTRRADGTPCVKVLDFGISKILGAPDLEMTKTQAVLGSPSYMSPEQMRSARTVDARTDIWSIGIILYRLVTGEAPFKADSITELVTKVLHSPARPPSQLVPDLPPGFDAVLMRCLERELEKRYANVGELSAALAPYAPEEARGSVERIARLLAGTSLGRGALPPPSAPRSTPSRGVSGDAWAATAFGPGTISMRRWKVVALAGGSLALALAGGVSLVASLRMGNRSEATPAAALSAEEAVAPKQAPAQPPPVVQPSATMQPQAAPNPAPAEPAPVVSASASASAAPRATAVPVTTAPRAVALRPKAAEPQKPADPPPPAPAPAPTAKNRMFGSEN
jgi:serine/threonine-protein kinase